MSALSMSPSIVPRHNGFGDGELLQDETRPLLYDVEDASRQRQPSTPLPKQQLGALCFIRLADPVAFTQIFPYVNEMMEKFGIAEPSQTGFYSGLVESVFAFAQLLSIYHWANLSDKLGRRPIVLLGTFGIAISTIWLGFSRTLSGVLLSRALAGLFSGNVAVMHSVLGEITDSSNQALAYPIYGLCWPLGVILGPLIGGTFANAAQKYPTWFGTYFFDQFPYFLPCFVVACATILTVVVGYFCLNETLPSKVRETGSIRTFIVAYTSNTRCLFVRIGYALAIAGVSSAMIQIIFMPILLRRVSCARLYKTCMGIWPLAFLSLPPLNWVARTGFDDATQAIGKSEVNLLLWLGIGTALALSRVACLAFSLNMILVKEHAPGPSSLGSANGLAQFSQCFARAIAPAFVSCLYAFSVDHNILGGNLWVILMFAFSTLAWLHSAIVPDDPHATAGDISTNMLASH